LADEKAVKPKTVADAIRKLGIDPDKNNPHYA
jgi:pyruvate dehydrogenase complex dehydrogenase (E1) component